jgi:hypothetical protein
MSLDKAIEHNKEHRKPFTKSKAFDYTCRNHGSCPYCQVIEIIRQSVNN